MCRSKNLASVAGICILTLALLGNGGTFGQIGTESEEVESSIFPPVQREYRLALGRAEKAIAEEDFAAAVEELTRILNGEDENDYFLASTGTADAQTSLKTQALRLLGSLPAKGRSLYELKCGHEARTLLDQALEKGDVALLTETARRFFHTQAGYEAVILLGRLNLDRGRPLAAALQFQRIAEIESAAAIYDPELSLLLATSWLHAQQPDLAQQTLVGLKQRLPQSRVRIGTDELALFASDETALDWLKKLVGQGGTIRSTAAAQWVMFRGNEMRNATSVASLPLLNYRWSLPVIGDPTDQQRVRNVAKSRMEKREALVPAVQPLVVNKYVVFRTPDRLVGADLETGKRIWIFPWDDSSYEKVARSSGSTSGSPAVRTREQELQQRLFDDHAFGQLSSDGDQVFFIDELGLAPLNGSINPNNIFRGRLQRNPLSSRPFNVLVSLSIPKQGALCWKVGGESGLDDPALAGAFFLGPPLPLGGQLYVLAEFNSEVRLLCLSARTGALEWKQTLAVMTEQQPIGDDPLRRLAGASPSFASGVLVCPTSGGGAVAVDLATRTLRWGYQYPRWDLPQAIARFGGFPRVRQRADEAEAAPTHWIDSAITVADGCVLLTPPESDKLHCLDLLSGKAKWSPLARGELLFVGCVHQGQAILVGRNQVKAVKLENGESGWPAVVDLGEETPTGRGYYSGRFYYLPLTSSQLWKIDLDKGEVVSRVKTEVTLGNLVCHQENLVSHAGEMLTTFYLTEPLRKRIDDLLAKNAANAWALARKGEILLQDGQQREAVDLLRKAHQLEPADEATKSMLVRVMLTLLREDYDAHANLIAETKQLVADQPTLAREFARLRAVALHKSGKLWDAFQAYLEIGRMSPADLSTLEEIDRDHLVRRDRWVAGKLAAVFSAADQATQERISAEIQQRRDKVLENADPEIVREFVSQFGFHPLAHQAMLRLAQLLLASNQELEAEVLIGELTHSREPAVAGAATAELAAIYVKSGQYELAAQFYAQLKNRFGDVVCRDGQTGEALAASAARSAELAPLVSQTWPSGQARVTVSPSESLARGVGDAQNRLQISEFRGAAPHDLQVTYLPREQAIRVTNGMGRSIATASLTRLGGLPTGFYGTPSNLATARLNGHLLVVGMGGDLFAVNALSAKAAAGDVVLWRQELLPPESAIRRQIYSTQQRTNPNPLIGGGRFTLEPQSQISVGPVTPLGICFQKGRQLICVDPITGITVWERTLSDTGCEIFGDDERVIVVPPKSREALILSTIDGEILDRRMIDSQSQRWVSCGRNVLVFENKDPVVTLQLYDVSNQGSGLWKREVKRGTRGTIIDGEELAILEPGGQFTIVSLRDGRELLSQRPKDLEFLGVNDLDSIAVLRGNDQYLLLANQHPTDADRSFTSSPVPTNGLPGATFHGQILAFDRNSGQMQWPTSAFVSQHALAADQPGDLPLLFFVRKVNMTRPGAAVIRNSTSVLVIDKRDGRTVFADDGFIANATHSAVAADPAKGTLSLTVTGSEASRTVTVELTDAPSPPQPPAQTGIRSSLTAGDPAGQVDPSAALAVERLRQEAELQRAGPGRQILPARNFRLPALQPGIPLPR